MPFGSSVEIVNPLTVPDWNARVLRHDYCSIFHSREWTEVLAESYRYTPMYAMISSEHAIQAVLPMMEIRSVLTGRRGVSLPFSDFCPALVDRETDRDRLWRCAQGVGRRNRWQYIGLRGRSADLTEAVPSQEFLTHDITFPTSEEAAFARLSGSVRRAVRKAGEMGVTALCGNSEQDVRDFCALNDRTRRRHGLPPQPRRFFRNLHRMVLSAGMGFICKAMHGNRPIAGAVFLTFGKNALFKYGASDERMQRLRANNLVMWEGIRHCIAEGCKTLSLGRTHPQNTGLRRFKQGWGAAEASVPYFRYDLRRDRFADTPMPFHGRHDALFRGLPLFLLRGIGTVLYRHVG